MDGRTIEVTAEQVHGAEYEAAWDQIAATASRFAGYQEKTDRMPPIIRLSPCVTGHRGGRGRIRSC